MFGNPHISAQYIRVLVRDFYLKTIDQYLSLESVVYKTMDSIIKDNLIHHLSTESLYYHLSIWFPAQKINFRNSLSTSFDWLNSFKNHCHTHCVFFDLSKAFDSISHKKLLQKLSLYSVHLLCLDWIKELLLSRTQQVKIKSTLSSSTVCRSGTP